MYWTELQVLNFLFWLIFNTAILGVVLTTMSYAYFHKK